MLESMSPLLISTVAIFLGVLFRTGIPYLAKLMALEEGETLDFDLKYLATALYSLAVSFVATMVLLPSFNIPQVPYPLLFAHGFTFGYASNDFINDYL